MPAAQSRDVTIDVLRGIAIFLMVYGNMGPLITEPHSWAGRIMASFAAPTFIMLAGMMVALGVQGGKNLLYFIQRGVFLLAIAALIDIGGWGLVPFMTVDVLYLIGVSIPIAYLVTRMPFVVAVAVTLVIFSATPILQGTGYSPYPTEYALSGQLTKIVKGQTDVLHHWLIDGWFPLFPWLGFMLMGTLFGRIRWPKKNSEGEFAFKEWGVAGLILIVSGAGLQILMPGPMYVREGYSEIFYPPMPGFMLMATGFTAFMLAVIDATPKWRVWLSFRPLGECALLMYTVHSFIIARALAPGLGEVSEAVAVPVFAVFVAALGALGVWMRQVRNKKRGMPAMVRWFIGG